MAMECKWRGIEQVVAYGWRSRALCCILQSCVRRRFGPARWPATKTASFASFSPLPAASLWLQPKFMRRWCDLSAVFFKHSKQRGNLRASVEASGLEWEGRAHSAIDDALNTAR